MSAEVDELVSGFDVPSASAFECGPASLLSVAATAASSESSPSSLSGASASEGTHE